METLRILSEMKRVVLRRRLYKSRLFPILEAIILILSMLIIIVLSNVVTQYSRIREKDILIMLFVVGIAILWQMFEILGTFLNKNDLMSERKVLAILFGFMIILGGISIISSYLLLGTTVSYKPVVNLYPEKASIQETFEYHVTKNTNFFRFFREYDLTGPMAKMTIKEISCPEGFHASKTGFFLGKMKVSCKSDEWIRAGEYKMTVSFDIPSPYTCYDDGCVFDWNAWTRFYLPVDRFEPEVHGAKKYWIFPKGITLPAVSGVLEIKAVVPKSRVVGVFQEKKGSIQGFVTQSELVSLSSFIFEHQFVAWFFAVLVFIGLLYLIYLKLGKDPYIPGIPEVVHYIPNSWKPYLVNQLVTSNPSRIDENGVLATLMDLAERGYLKMKDGVVRILKDPDDPRVARGLDEYELKVLRTYKFLAGYSNPKEPNTVDMNNLKRAIVMEDNEGLIRLTDKIKELYKAPRDEYDWTARHVALVFLGVSLIVITSLPIIAPSFGWIPVIGTVVGVASVSTWLQLGLVTSLAWAFLVVAFLDRTAFGRYKKEVLKGVLMWQAFKRLLSDYSLIRKYGPKDVSMWGKWLVYATALDEADNVIKALKEYGVRVPRIDYHNYNVYSIGPVYMLATGMMQASGGGISGGGGGIGGGFGGGGAGME